MREVSSIYTYPRALRPGAAGFRTRFAVALGLERVLLPLGAAFLALVALVALVAARERVAAGMAIVVWLFGMWKASDCGNDVEW